MTENSTSTSGRMTENSNGVVILILLNILVQKKLQQLQEEKYSEQTNQLSLALQKVCRRFSLRDLQWATFNFSDNMVIGQGGFGKVYKGIIDFGASIVAIKRLKSMSKQGSREFLTEIEMLSQFKHTHLVSLVGYCDECNEMILVYEHMPCGTLADHLHKRFRKGDDSSSTPLSWEKRLKICIGAARGIDYLHTGTSAQQRVIHRDVKSSNILLDENMEAKVSDFGLSKIGPANQSFSTYVSTHIKGSPGYLDPYYFATHRLTRKSDVYSFGVVLFEVLCGRPAVDGRLDEEQRGLAGWAQYCSKEGLLDQIIDPRIKAKILPNSLDAFVNIAIQCLQTGPKQRPTMAEVVVGLESALALQERGTTYTLPEVPLTNSDQVNVNTYSSSLISDHNQEHVVSSMAVVHQTTSHSQTVEEGVIKAADGMNRDGESPARMTIKRMAGLFLSSTARMFSVHCDGMPSRNKRKNNINSSIHINSAVAKDGVIQEARGRIVTPNLKVFTFAELRTATQGFARYNMLGEEGRVFKGWVDEKTYAPSKAGVGMAIAVKIINLYTEGVEEWLEEIKILGKYSHPNLVKLFGYCGKEREKLYLVYEYMQKGSLDNCFHKRREALTFSVRLKILIGTARCLTFLHTADEQVILRDLKTSTILLDTEYNPKISDLGMAKLRAENYNSHVSTRVMGTHGYAAPEYVSTGHLGVKSDVYSFGVIFLELLTGMRSYDLTQGPEKRNLVEWAKPLLANKSKSRKILDPSLANDFRTGKMLRVVSPLVLKCLEPYPKNRPSMPEVLEVLETLVPSSDCEY